MTMERRRSEVHPNAIRAGAQIKSKSSERVNIWQQESRCAPVISGAARKDQLEQKVHVAKGLQTII